MYQPVQDGSGYGGIAQVLAPVLHDAVGAKGISLICVKEGPAGFSKSRRLEKIGLEAQDTSELFFEDVRVPVSNRLGEQNLGFKYLMHELAHERLVTPRRRPVSRCICRWTLSYRYRSRVRAQRLGIRRQRLQG